MTDSLALMPPIDTLDADMLDASAGVLLRDLLAGTDDVLYHDLFFYETDDDAAARDDFRRWYARPAVSLICSALPPTTSSSTRTTKSRRGPCDSVLARSSRTLSISISVRSRATPEGHGAG